MGGFKICAGLDSFAIFAKTLHPYCNIFCTVIIMELTFTKNSLVNDLCPRDHCHGPQIAHKSPRAILTVLSQHGIFS